MGPIKSGGRVRRTWDGAGSRGGDAGAAERGWTTRARRREEGRCRRRGEAADAGEQLPVRAKARCGAAAEAKCGAAVEARREAAAAAKGRHMRRRGPAELEALRPPGERMKKDGGEKERQEDDRWTPHVSNVIVRLCN